jgi:hypothetical protein
VKLTEERRSAAALGRNPTRELELHGWLGPEVRGAKRGDARCASRRVSRGGEKRRATAVVRPFYGVAAWGSGGGGGRGVRCEVEGRRGLGGSSEWRSGGWGELGGDRR